MRALDYLQNGSERSQQELDAIDARDRPNVVIELENLWGKDKVTANVAAINSYLDQLPAGESIRHARASDGKAVFSDAANVQRLLGLARQPRPDLSGTREQKLAAISAFIRSNRQDWNRSESEWLHAYHRELLAQGAGS